MNKKKIVLLSGIIVISLCCIGIGLNAIIDTRPLRYCELQDIILNKGEIPEGSIIGYREVPSVGGPKESGVIEFSLNADSFYYEIIRFKRIRFAKDHYKDWGESAIQYSDENGHRRWDKPSEIEVNNEYATIYDYGCAVSLGSYQCRLIATYGEYFIYLRSDISEKGITYELFNDLLETIDEKMSTCFMPEN